MKDEFEHLLPGHEDELTRWRREAAELEERGAKRRSSDQVRAATSRAELEQLRGELRQLRAELEVSRQADLKAIADLAKSLADLLDDLPRMIETIASRSHNELRGLIAERFGELVGQIRAIDPTAVKAGFRFAGEANDDSDVLPNPLRRREVN
jgi:hypothetical protein